MQLIDHTFTDAGEHAALLADWDQQYFQLDAGRFHGTLRELSADGMHLFSESVNRRLVQRGSAPSGTVAFGIVLNAQGPLTFLGHSVRPDSIIFARPNREFFLHSPGCTELLGIGLTQARLERHPRLAARIEKFVSSSASVVAVAPDTRAHFAARWPHFIEEARAMIAFAEQPIAEQGVSAQLIDLLDQLLDNEQGVGDADITWMSHSDVVARAHQMIVAHPQEPVTVLQLCEALRISRRTAQNSFRLVTGKSPIEYMRAVRLNLVRRMLRTSSPAELTVRDAAQHWGFFHSGHFTQDYRKLFDAMPSDSRPH